MSELPVFETRHGYQYEWCALKIYRHPKNPQRVAVFSASGCSCNYFKEPNDAELAAAEPYDRAGARMLMVNYLRKYHYHIDAGAAITCLERFEVAMNEEFG